MPGLLPAGAQRGGANRGGGGGERSRCCGSAHPMETWGIPSFDTALGRVVGVLEQFREVEEAQLGDGDSSSRPAQVFGNEGAG